MMNVMRASVDDIFSATLFPKAVSMMSSAELMIRTMPKAATMMATMNPARYSLRA